METLRRFIQERHEYLPDGLKTCCNLTGPYQLRLKVKPAGAGKIEVNSLSLKEFPWEGRYYGGVATKLKATAHKKRQYVFDHWTLSNHTVDSPTANTLTIDLSSDDCLVAHFRPVGK